MNDIKIIVNSLLLYGAKTELIVLGIAVAAIIGLSVFWALRETKKNKAEKNDA